MSEAAKTKMMERREELKRLKMKARQQLQEKETETDSNRVEEAKEEESMMRSEEAESAVEGVHEVRESKTVEVPSAERIAHEEDTETHELRLQKRELEGNSVSSELMAIFVLLLFLLFVCKLVV